MPILSENASVFNSVLPSIRRSYTLPQKVTRGTGFSCEKNSPLPPKWIQKLFEDYYNESPADFYDIYFPQLRLGMLQQEKVLLIANNVLKEGLSSTSLDYSHGDPLINMEAVRLAYNASVYGHNMFKIACFLKEQNQLPKECEILFERKINPSLYQEKELFTKVEKSLSEVSPKIELLTKTLAKVSPDLLHQWKQQPFLKWLHADTDNSEKYLKHLKQMLDIEDVLDSAAEYTVGYVGSMKERHLNHRNHSHASTRRIWRGSRE